MKKKLHPAMGRAVLRNLTTDERTESGLYLPGGAQTLAAVAEVIAICEPYETDFGLKGPLYAVGDVVVIGKYNGVDVEVGRDKLIVLQETDILGRLVDEESKDAPA